MILILLLLVCVLCFLNFLTLKTHNYWTERNVKTGKCSRLFGDNFRIITCKESFAEYIDRTYHKLSNVRYIGMYQFLRPVLLIKSPELIKQMCVKDFDHFLNHNNIVPEGADELWANTLMALKGQAWKNMRVTFSPSFTSGKMKAMFVLFCHNAQIFVQHFLKMDEKIIELDFMETYMRYANDIIASTAFGIEINSLENRENEFYLMGKKANFNSFWRKMAFFLFQIAPKIALLLRVPMLDKKMKSFFMNLVKDSIKLRKEQNIKRPDMLGILLEARKGHQKETPQDEIKDTSFAVVEEYLETKGTRKKLTDSEIASQVFVFFLGGFDAISSTMCFMSYELAINPDIQKKLLEEVDEHNPQNGSPSYETIVNMTYLDMVLSETLRKWPIGVATDRVVTKPYTIQPELPDEEPLYLETNVNIVVPIFALHRDPNYFENPEKFDPERFSPENRKNIIPYTYLPFGVGPRNCVASRFALLEVKSIMFHLLSHFEVVPVEKTQMPLKISKKSFNLTSENGFPLGLKKRN